MAGVFTVVWVATLAALVLCVKGFWSARHHKRWRALGYVPLIVLCGVVLAYLVAKLVYEEIVPCVAVDPRHCDVDSTQHRNLFGWKF